MAVDYVERARALVGVPFRPQGRSPAGVDCVGLVLLTFDLPADSVRRDYRLRGRHQAEVQRETKAHFRSVSRGERRAGDLMLMAAAPDQVHFGVLTDRGFVHAHAGIGRVVETPGTPDWPILAILRKRVR